MENEWYIRLLVLCSLLFQVLLYLLAPLRRRTCSKWELCSISMVFSVCSWLPAFTLLLICCLAVVRHDDASDHNPPLLMWASLMLLHIAGLGQEREAPYSLQTSDHGKDVFQILLKFVFYDVILFGTIFLFQSWKEMANLTPSFIVFILACRRTFSKLKCFRDLRKEVEDLSNLEVSFPHEVSSAVSDDRELMTLVQKLFQVSYKLIWGYKLTDSERHICGAFFLKMTPTYAIRMLEVERKLIYDKFYGGVLPSESEIVIMVFLLPVIEAYSTCLSIPLLRSQIQSGFYKLDIFVDHFILCIHHFVVAYIWWMMWRTLPEEGNNVAIHGFNLLDYGLRKPRKFSAFMGHLLNTWPVSGSERFTDSTGELILKELQLRIRGLGIDLTTRMISGKGQWILEETGHPELVDQETAFVETVLIWHLATTVLYHTSSNMDAETRSVRYMSMLLSDYMGYLLIVQPHIMSKQRGYVLGIVQEALSDINALIHSCGTLANNHTQTEEGKLNEIGLAMRSLKDSKDDQTPSVVHDANALAEQIKCTFPNSNTMWAVISKVWVEMLTYGAVHSDPVNHIRGLSRGGELASMVWLCATHFGLVGNFYESSRCRQQGRPVRRRRLAHLESSSMISAPSEDRRRMATHFESFLAKRLRIPRVARPRTC